MRVPPILRIIAQAPYYRRHWGDAVREVAAANRFKRERAHDPREFLRRLGIAPELALDGFERWRPLLEQACARVDATMDGKQGGCSIEDGMVLYGLTRMLRPRILVETGVAAGISTSFLGAAMIENGEGTLYSIELPPAEVFDRFNDDGTNYVWTEGGVGWAIPEQVRQGISRSHHLILEDVRTALPRLLEELPAIDLYFHDDLHTPDHMLWQYRAVWPRLRPGGVLVSDDSNIGWVDFCQEIGVPEAAYRNMQRLTAIRKQGAPPEPPAVRTLETPLQV